MTAAGPVTARIEIDGAAATLEQLRTLLLASYGHFTAMQVRGRRVRGLDLHLARLGAANREMFGQGLDTALVRAHILHALGEDTGDASVRVYVQEAPGGPCVMVTVRPPGGMPGGPWRLLPVPYQRPLAHIKHIGDFGQGYYQRLAHRSGFDEALLTGPGGSVSEGAITNIGFFDGTGVVWPAAPALAGITMQLLDRELAGCGLTSRRAPIRLPDLGMFAAAFATNARGVVRVGQIGDLVVPADPALMSTLARAYDAAPWAAL